MFQPKYLLCPQESLHIIPFRYDDCNLPSVYIIRPMHIPAVSWLFGDVMLSEFNVHLWVMTLFACLIAPFGGFFASGLKRGLKIKDFANLIPGHGGLTDRLDCHILMMIFTSIYHREIVLGAVNSLSRVLFYVSRLRQSEKEFLYIKLGEMLNKV